MTEPATKSDLDALEARMMARIDVTDRNVEGMRSQNSAEHGSIFSRVAYGTEIMVWLKQQWHRFGRGGTWPGDGK